MKLVIAEKPSVARDIADFLGAHENIDGVMYGNGYAVYHALGHLVRLKEPQEYDENLKAFKLETLPIIPEFDFVELPNTVEVLNKLRELMNSDEIDSIVCATDAGREGECIFRYVYNYIGCTKPFERLWISSLTAESIRKGFQELLPSSSKDAMYDAGFTRNKVDWIFGMNLSRLYTIYFHDICSIGRVQTAVVNMIVQRDSDIKQFVKKPYYKLLLSNGAEWFDDDVDSFRDFAEAEAVKKECENQVCTVQSVETVLKKENRPLLFSLTSLQEEANEKLGLSAAKTLLAMQSLYEKKLLTYPRTDSNYLTEDIAPQLEKLLKLSAFINQDNADEILRNGLNIDRRIINDKKVSDHHAIIPTENIANVEKMQLTADEQAILEMVLTRFMAALSAEYQYNETSTVFVIGKHTFRSKSKITVQLGWKKFYIEKNDEQNVLSFSQGETFVAENLSISECETQPPKHYTESTLLKAMGNIDKRIDDKELSSYVSERGIGTPATRAGIIERVIKVGYIERKGKSLIATEKGNRIISALPEQVKSVEMTANMEKQLEGIEKGENTPEEVIDDVIELVKKVIAIEQTKEHKSMAAPRTALGKCPRCGGAVFEGKKGFYCENVKDKGCIFSLWKDDIFWTSKKKILGAATVKALLSKGKVSVKGLYSSNTGKTYDAVIKFADYTDKNGKLRVGYEMDFDNSKPKKKK